jgi:hypothetical protein
LFVLDKRLFQDRERIDLTKKKTQQERDKKDAEVDRQIREFPIDYLNKIDKEKQSKEQKKK